MLTSQWTTQPQVMGIINVTPDSFSDGGRFNQVDSAVAHAHQLIAEGADMLDIGGESTRPGADPVSIEEEINRVLPVVYALKDCGVPLSIDTRHHELMQRVLDVGVEMINDVTALIDPLAVDCCRQAQVKVCIMHMQGEPNTMQHQPHYTNVVEEIYSFLNKRIDELVTAGINRDKIYIDPGFGFGKTVDHNLKLLQQLSRFRELGCPLLIGVSRKSFLGKVTNTEVNERMLPSVIAALWATLSGADILRVHDVKQTKQALIMWQAIAEGEYR
ncbi:dihydropteroate synthase [Ferrovum sp. PN-J185]|uniref:dihydropteroate synthase n=1 Tax=Ferrovum sp. PN-J185 TaxID=1356306 RepID=UPI000791B9B3|nr:dihydropteroate synthase [Ferrovum sp. PN-J185]KXW56169.1 dihydropteroate synthase [Ferrovum sp. PN-J185]MCC6067769.1 dihydropteroate synthase [Ferrovum sp. PN-J185]MDE1892213.1 dihydropteroate synthase [Betaproteobacteria bacterium]MDE2056811.1 dihydropteroate synthase [Betaproteobacteria bacterium]